MTGAYRQRIYDLYASRGSDAPLVFDVAAAERRSAYLRAQLAGWLPADKAAAVGDLACGSGDVLFALRSFGYTNLCGVDISGEQVAVAQQQFGDRVKQQSVQAFLDEHESTFDVLLAIDIIEHLSKDEVLPFLDSCQAALRPGGRLILQTPNAASPFGMSVRYGDFTHEAAFTPASLAWLLTTAGLCDITARECGPRPVTPFGAGRWLIWQVLRLLPLGWNLIETGSVGSGVLSRVFVISGVRG